MNPPYFKRVNVVVAFRYILIQDDSGEDRVLITFNF